MRQLFFIGKIICLNLFYIKKKKQLTTQFGGGTIALQLA